MITSNVGIVEVPHMTASVGIVDLAKGMVSYYFSDIVDKEIWFFPGVKNNVPEVSIENCEAMDKIPEPIMIPLTYINDGYTPLALLTLGIQIANISWKIKYNQVATINAIRLLLSPLIAFFIVVLLGISGVMAQVLIISSAVPTLSDLTITKVMVI